MPTITKVSVPQRKVIQAKTTPRNSSSVMAGGKWWEAGNNKDLAAMLVDTAAFLKDQQNYRFRQAGIYARMYGNMPLGNVAGSNLSKMITQSSLPIDRPTMNVVQSCIDTLVSRLTQSRPRPIFLTDNSDYKERNLAKELNQFIVGELYQTKAYELGELILRDACVLGPGCVKVYETPDNRVGLERVLYTELYVDPNDALYGHPRQLYQLKLIDRAVAAEWFSDGKSNIESADQAFPENGADSQKTVADQIMLVEGWRLPSAKDKNDGLHAIACSSGMVMKEKWTKDYFPFEFLQFSPRLLGFWGQGLTEQLMGTQIEINKLLRTISHAINIVGVPRVFVETGSKVGAAMLTNGVGAIIKYQGVKPIYEVAPCVPEELYGQLQRLVEYAYQQSGVSALAASSQKPAGLNSGEAIRNYDDLQSDRFAALSKRYDNFFIGTSYKITDLAREIAERDGEYQTIYPNKNGTREIDLPAAKLLDNPFVIQCFDASSLPRDPAGRLQKITEMMQSGMITLREGRRLLDYPDLEQDDKLANAAEERILSILDGIVDKGKSGYEPPDPFMDLAMATDLTTKYINLYLPAGLEESRAQLLRDFFTQVQTLTTQASQPPVPGTQAASPQAVPQAPPVSDMLPTAPGQ